MEFSQPPYSRYGRWTFDFQYPGYFEYTHATLPFTVYFTPGFNAGDEVSLQISREDISEGSVEVVSIPFFSNTASDLFAIVRQWLDFVEWNVLRGGVLDWHPDGPKWIPRER